MTMTRENDLYLIVKKLKIELRSKEGVRGSTYC